MRGKFMIFLDDRDQVQGVVEIKIEVPEKLRQVLRLKGFGDQEIDNLIGTKFQEFIDNNGLTEVGGI